ncbi:MAG TPA: two-component regulator propeller domain-containing protein, partial [Prolixibacteraceae bacterium]|nr:two-component regulator propeller domain-containing protein [Prolixibacteraceae bacterium]
MRRGVVFFIILLVYWSVSLADEQFYFKRLSVSEGLSNSWVRCSYQDDYGYLWFGTDDGLNRFDGRNVKVFRPVSKDNLVIGNVTINSILRCDSGSLWLCTDVGLFRFVFESESFVRDSLLPAHPVLTAVMDHDQNFWFGTNRGVYKINRKENIETHYLHDPEVPFSISDDYINTLMVDSKGGVWVGTKKGLSHYNKNNDSFTNYLHSTARGSISGGDVVCVCEDRTNRIWVGTSLDGLNLFSGGASGGQFKKVLDGSVCALLVDDKNKLWVGNASGEGIAIIDLNNFQQGDFSVLRLKNDPLDVNSLGDNSIFNLYKDRNNDIWVATFGGGVNFYSSRSKQFHVVKEQYESDRSIRNNLVNAFFEEEKYLWIGTEGGLDRLDKKSGQYKHYSYESNNPRSLISNPVLSICKDHRGDLWIGTWAGGVHRYNYATDDFTRFAPDGKPGSLGSANVLSICADSHGNLWVGTAGGGLNRYDYSTGKFRVYIKEDNHPRSLRGRSMSHVFQTSTGDLYISMYGTLERYNYATDDFDHLRPIDQSGAGNILYLFEDSRKNLWIATNSGLEQFNPADGSFKVYTSNDGLPDNTIQGILEDKHGNLWISTNKGISKFLKGIEIPDRPVFQNYTVHDGLPTNDFKKKAAFKNEKGVMFFGSSKGYVYFDPDMIFQNEIIPNVVLTQFLLLETSPNANSKFKEISSNITLTNHLELHYPNTDFTIGFAALNYLSPVKNQFRYKLEGYDTKWIDAENNTTATYTNLIEGRYVFKVMGSNNDGLWNPAPRQIVIEIFPPWWRSTPFKILLIIIILLTITVVVVTRFVMLNRENKLLEAIIDKRTNELSKLNDLLEKKQSVILEQNEELSKHRNHLEILVEERTKELAASRLKAEESDRLKSAFLANMSHEIRTPMNAIVGFSSLLVSNDLPQEKREKYSELIRNNSKLLFGLINDIIDISIIEANQLVLSKGRFNVTTLLKELYHYFEIENKNRLNFRFVNQDDPEDLVLINDSIRFRQVMVNLLSNAFKYTERGMIEYGY